MSDKSDDGNSMKRFVASCVWHWSVFKTCFSSYFKHFM